MQRVSPTEKRGRVHTSTITVAVLSTMAVVTTEIPPAELDWKMTIGTGNGGQSRNTTYSCVVLTHRPSKIVVRCQSERSQLQNKQAALTILRARLAARKAGAAHEARNDTRAEQIGSGMRGDKRRTIRNQDGRVKDHLTGRTWETDRYWSGKW